MTSPTTVHPRPDAGREPSLAERIAAVVAAHPAVARLDAGEFGALATYLPGRRLVGVRIGPEGERVELGVVLRLDRPIPEVARALRRQVAPLSGDVPVDITVTDVDTDGSSENGP